MRALRRQGLDFAAAPPVALAGHSQGVLGVEAFGAAGAADVELLALAQLIGAAGTLVARRRGITASGDRPPMVAVTNAAPERIADLLEEFPDARFNIDAKSDAAVDPLLAVLHRHESVDRVCIGSFSHRRLARIRRRVRVCTSASPREVVQWLAGVVPSAPDCFQVPVASGPVSVVTARSVARAQRAGKPVHVWTVDEPREMQRLIDLGVDGIMTDDPATLKRVAAENGLWPTT